MRYAMIPLYKLHELDDRWRERARLLYNVHYDVSYTQEEFEGVCERDGLEFTKDGEIWGRMAELEEKSHNATTKED